MKNNKRNLFIISVLFIMMSITGITPAFAAEDAIPSISIEVILNNDGSALITEIWEVRGVYSGTEYYKALHNMDGMSVHSLKVWDESGIQFKALENWDTSLSREEKAGTSGILKTSEGYELCWGIGSYGDREYTIQYTLEGLVKNYGDYAGFYHRFISDLSSAPESIYIKISMEDTSLTKDNARIWGYGFQGEVEISKDGILKVFSSEALGRRDYVNVLSRFDKELFPLAATANMSFEQLQESAENDNSDIDFIVLFIALAIVLIVIVFTHAFFHSRYKLADGTSVRLQGKEHIYSTCIPLNGSIPAVYSAMKLLRKEIPYENLIGAYLIRWQKAGYISIEERELKESNKEEEKEEAITFRLDATPTEIVEQRLFNYLMDYADQDGILLKSVVEESAEELYDKLTDWAIDVKKEGRRELINLNLAAKDTKGILRFTATGFDQAVQILGLKEYLMEMHRPNEKGDSFTELWGDYLVFAALFDMGERVLESMKNLEPEYFGTFSRMYGCNAYSMMYLMNRTNHITSATTPNISGTGGSTSSFGGGGFSGGGGGGSR
ncbi:DUF2207 domain-containing protein [Alkalicella caledoniensis]|uniref:DUF2207 domain-containing protein n=1 Tax=Alkalicella caledoniensis TaxID=2731377 RepID=A0A7G9W6I3_ALKCA|nr:DUF2207 domain-containing protein [Alkalicella caledoniensis]QNO14295.1 DUF2207 domain-containing protein [Alkalicella caledoniensis]